MFGRDPRLKENTTDWEHVHLRQQDTRRITYAVYIHSGLELTTSALSQYPSYGRHTPAGHYGASAVLPLSPADF